MESVGTSVLMGAMCLYISAGFGFRLHHENMSRDSASVLITQSSGHLLPLLRLPHLHEGQILKVSAQHLSGLQPHAHLHFKGDSKRPLYIYSSVARTQD